MPAPEIGRAEGPPQIAFTRWILLASSNQIAPRLGVTPTDVLFALQARGIDGADPDMPLARVARAAGQYEGQLARLLTPLSH